MKITVDYMILNGRPLERQPLARAVKVITEHQTRPEHADFPQQHIEFSVEDGSDAARAICAALGLVIPKTHD